MILKSFCVLLVLSSAISDDKTLRKKRFSSLTTSNDAYNTPSTVSSSEIDPEKEVQSASYKLYSVQRNSENNRVTDSTPQQKQQQQQQQNSSPTQAQQEYSVNYRPSNRQIKRNTPQKNQRISNFYSSETLKPSDVLRELSFLSLPYQNSNSTPLLSDSVYDSLFGNNDDSGFDRHNSAFLDIFSPEKNTINEYGNGNNDYDKDDEDKKNDFGEYEDKKKNNYRDYEEKKKNDYGFYEEKKKNDYGFFEEKKKDDGHQGDEHKDEIKKDFWGEEDKRKEDEYGNYDRINDENTQFSPREPYEPIVYHNQAYQPYQGQNYYPEYSQKTYNRGSKGFSQYKRNHDNQIAAAIRSEHTLQTYPVKNNHRPSYKHAFVDIKSSSTLPLTLNFHTESTQIHARQSHHSPEGSIKHEISMEQPDVLIKVVKKPVIQQVREIIFPLRHRLQEVRPVYEHVETVIAKDQYPISSSEQKYKTYNNHHELSHAQHKMLPKL